MSELLNSLEVARIFGTLEIVLAPDEMDDVTLEHLASARQVRIGPGANVVAVRLPVLETLEGLTVRLNEPLTTFSAPSLREVSSVFVFAENPALPTCDAESVLSQLTTPPEQVLVEANCYPCCSDDG